MADDPVSVGGGEGDRNIALRPQPLDEVRFCGAPESVDQQAPDLGLVARRLGAKVDQGPLLVP